VTEKVHGARAEARYANLDYTGWVTSRTHCTKADYQYYSLSSLLPRVW